MQKDNFSVTIKLKWYNLFNRDKRILLEFEEANIEETLEFLEKIEKADFSTIEYLYNFFKKTSNWKINKKIFTKYLSNNLGIILEILKKTYIKGVYSTENNEKIENKDEIPQKMDLEEFLTDFGRLIAFLTDKISLDPNSILKNYTWRQLNFRTKHYLYNERAKTEEGQKENKKQENKEFTKKYEKEIKESLENIEKYLNKKT